MAYNQNPSRDKCMVKPEQVLDRKQREKFKQKLKSGQAHELARMVEQVSAVWGFINEDAADEDNLPDMHREFVKSFCEASAFMVLSSLALHGEPGQFTVKKDMPFLLQQLPGAMAAGLERGALRSYMPQADVESIAKSKAAVVLLSFLIEQTFAPDGASDYVSDYGSVHYRLAFYQRPRAHMVLLLLTTHLASLEERDLGLLDSILTRAKEGFVYGDPQAIIAEDRKMAADMRTQVKKAQEAAQRRRTQHTEQSAGGLKIDPDALQYMQKAVEEMRSFQTVSPVAGSVGSSAPGKLSEELNRAMAQDMDRLVQNVMTELRMGGTGESVQRRINNAMTEFMTKYGLENMQRLTTEFVAKLKAAGLSSR